jgi:hypothetical protein
MARLYAVATGWELPEERRSAVELDEELAALAEVTAGVRAVALGEAAPQGPTPDHEGARLRHPRR